MSCLWSWYDFRSIFHAEIISAFCVFTNNDVPSPLSPRLWYVTSIFGHVFFMELSFRGIRIPAECLLKSLPPLARLSVRPSVRPSVCRSRTTERTYISLRIGELLSLCNFNFDPKSLTARLTVHEDVHYVCAHLSCRLLSTKTLFCQTTLIISFRLPHDGRLCSARHSCNVP